MSRRILDRLDARHYGDDEGADPSELHGVAPPCKRCGSRERVEDGLCSECLDDDRDDVEERESR